jgi:protein involved in polysaccharide export with SLBB domain
MTVVELISTAGGFTKISDTNNVKVIRTDPDGSKRTITVRVNDIINKGKEDADIQLKPKDIVTVGESFF